MNPPAPLVQDLHVHSTFSDGKGTLDENIAAATAARVEVLGLVDHVRRDTTWVPHFLAEVDARGAGTPLRLLAGLEAKLLDTEGAVDAPDDAHDADFVVIADHVVPTAAGPLHPADARSRLADGRLSPVDLLDDLVAATLSGAVRYDRVLVAHLFSVLPKAGLTEDDVPDELVRDLARGLADAGAVVELSERWRCPGLRVARLLHEAGVALVASTDSHRPETIGRYDHVARVVAALPAGAIGPTAVRALTGPS